MQCFPLWNEGIKHIFVFIYGYSAICLSSTAACFIVSGQVVPYSSHFILRAWLTENIQFTFILQEGNKLLLPPAIASVTARSLSYTISFNPFNTFVR